MPSGLKWSAWNVGATKAEEYGLYFAWGETVSYNANRTYKYADSNGKITKYNEDGLTTLELVDDAAYVTDNTCRMPTADEMQELIANTTSACTQVNGVSGVTLTSKVNENSIFVPAAGAYFDGSNDTIGKSARVWTSSLSDYSNDDTPDYLCAQYLGIADDTVIVSNVWGVRGIGCVVRPVKE